MVRLKVFVTLAFSLLYLVLTSSHSFGVSSTWTVASFPNSRQPYTVHFANNLFVAAPWDQSATYVLTSTDGTTWTERSIPVAGGWEAISYGNGVWVVVGDVGAGSAVNKYIYSSDGITWSASNTVPSGAVRDVAFGNGIFVATHGGGCSNQCIRTSTDGITWTQRSTPNTGNYRSVVYTGSAFYAGSNTGQGITSTDGLTWTSTPDIGNSTEELAYGAGVWVSIANGSIYSSSNFSSWTQSTGYSTGKNWQHVLYANNKFTAIAYDGTINTSSNGSSWESDTSNLMVGGFLAFGAGKFVALSYQNAYATLTVKITPTFTWSNVSKTYGDTAFRLTAPTSSTSGSFTYSSATTSVISLTSDTATVVAPGTSVITASFTPTDTATYNSATTTMTVTVSKAAQSTLTFALSTASKNSPYSQAITMTPSGGSGTGAITYAIAAGGTASSCALANSTETNTVTATSGGTCLIQATKATDTNYLVATSATQTFTFNAPLTLIYAVGDSGTGTAPTLSGTYFAGDTATVAAGSALSRAGFTFDGWRNTSNASVAAGSTFTFSINDTLTAQWRQTSLYGLSDSEITELQSWNASTNTNSGTVSNASSSFTVTVPGSSLPTGTTVKLWEVANSNLARSKVGSDKDYIVNLVVSWLKSDGTVPTASLPITLSISNSSIKNGAIAYQIIGNSVTQIGTATADGLISLSVTDDPVLAIANPVSTGGGGGGSGGGGSVGGGSVGLPLTEDKSKLEEQPKSNESIAQSNKLLRLQHTVTFGISAAWLNSYNIKQVRAFLDSTLQKVEVNQVTVKAYVQPSKIQLPNLDLARARAVVSLLKREGLSAKYVIERGGVAPSKSGDKSRIAIITVEGREKIN